MHSCAKNLARLSTRTAGMVGRPDHGPGIDVEELTTASRRALTITLSFGVEACKITPIIGNCSGLAERHQSKPSQNISHWDNVDNRLRRGLIEKLSSSVCNLPPPIWPTPAVNHCQRHGYHWPGPGQTSRLPRPPPLGRDSGLAKLAKRNRDICTGKSPVLCIVVVDIDHGTLNI